MGKLSRSSNWTLAAVYGGFAVAVVNPIAGVIFAAGCYKVKKKIEEQEKIERTIRFKVGQEEFRKNFYTRQNFSSYAEYIESDTWRSKREEIFERANGICEKPDCPHSLVDVHHIWYPHTWGKEPLTALIGLCRQHHQNEHSHWL